MSFVGNCGTFTRGYKAMIMDVEFLYHLLYLLICALGLFVHEFFYSLLVGIHLALRTLFCLCVCKVPSWARPGVVHRSLSGLLLGSCGVGAPLRAARWVFGLGEAVGLPPHLCFPVGTDKQRLLCSSQVY